jgi:hypothetical protein
MGLETYSSKSQQKQQVNIRCPIMLGEYNNQEKHQDNVVSLGIHKWLQVLYFGLLALVNNSLFLNIIEMIGHLDQKLLQEAENDDRKEPEA